MATKRLNAIYAILAMTVVFSTKTEANPRIPPGSAAGRSHLPPHRRRFATRDAAAVEHPVLLRHRERWLRADQRRQPCATSAGVFAE